MSKILGVKLAYPNYTRDESKFKIDNFFFNICAKFPRDNIYGFAVDDAILSPELEIFKDILPQENGEYKIELGAELIELYPNLEDAADFDLIVKSAKGDLNRIFVSNQMAKMSFAENGEVFQLLFNQFYKNEILKNDEFNIPERTSIENLKTFITWQINLKGDSIQYAFETFVDDKIEDFVFLINEFVSFLNLVYQEKSNIPFIIPSYSRFTIPYFYFIIKGRDDKTGFGKIATHIKGISYVTDNLDADQTNHLLELLKRNNEINLWDFYFANGKSLVLNGQLRSGLLSLFTCCEIILSQYVTKSILKSGVSKTKLDSAQKDITFSQMLNIFLFTLTAPDDRPNADLIGRIDSMRRIRNDLIHSGKFELNYENTFEFVSDVFDFRNYISYLLTKL